MGPTKKNMSDMYISFPLHLFKMMTFHLFKMMNRKVSDTCLAILVFITRLAVSKV